MPSIEKTGGMPKAFFYALSLAILLSGWGAAARIGWNLIQAGNGLMLMNAPGSKVFRLAAGNYVLYHEYEGVSADKIYYQPLAPQGLSIAIKGTGGAGSPEYKPLEPKAVYAFGSRRGAEIAAIHVKEGGDYLLEAAPQNGAAAPATLLAVGNGLERLAVRRYQIAIALTLAATLLSALLWLWTTFHFWRSPGGEVDDDRQR